MKRTRHKNVRTWYPWFIIVHVQRLHIRWDARQILLTDQCGSFVHFQLRFHVRIECLRYFDGD